MSDLSWIKELVKSEREMEESGMVDMSAGVRPEQTLGMETIKFLRALKDQFVQYSSAFNQMRGVTIGAVKIYGISNTQADFMLFRNGFKLIFSYKQPGKISVRFYHQGVGVVSGATTNDRIAEKVMNADILEAQWGAFGQIIWTHDKLEISIPHLVRYYLTRFIKESAK